MAVVSVRPLNVWNARLALMTESMHGPEALARAKELFRQFDGSRFHMDRDGFSEEFDRYNVPVSLQTSWLAEITDRKLTALAMPGNWSVVYFLAHHSDFAHLDALLGTAPIGVAWERCAYLEELLLLLDRCADGQLSGPLREPTIHDVAKLRTGVEQIHGRALAMLDEDLPGEVMPRVQAIISNAEKRLAAASETGDRRGGFWRWSSLTRAATPVR